MGGYAHHSAFTVAHQHVITDPDFKIFARERMLDIKACGYTFFFTCGQVGFTDATLGAFIDKGL